MMTTEELAFALIAVFEGCKLTAYRDSGGVLTIGLGHTGPDVTEGLVISEPMALELFSKDVAHLLVMVKDLPPLEAAVLVSFGYNCGAGALQAVRNGHDLVNNPKHSTDRHGVTQPGLVNRRRLESDLQAFSQEIEGGA